MIEHPLAASWTVRMAVSGFSKACEPILRDLPEWFGNEETNLRYLQEIDVNPTFLVCNAERAVGFLSLLEHTEFSAEINIIAVYRTNHRQGAGRVLVRSAEDYLRSRGVKFLQVKTLSSKNPDPRYAATREFYRGIGFVPLQEFPELWEPRLPCLQLVKAL